MPRINDYQINFRTTQEKFMFLHEFENYTEFLNNLIDDHLIKINDKKYIDSKIIYYEQEIKKLKDQKKLKNVDQSKINELLSYHAPNYKKNAPFRSESQRFKFLEKAVRPQLKKYGYTGSMEELDNLLLKWEG